MWITHCLVAHLTCTQRAAGVLSTQKSNLWEDRQAVGNGRWATHRCMKGSLLSREPAWKASSKRNPSNFLPGGEKEWHHDRVTNKEWQVWSDKYGVTSVVCLTTGINLLVMLRKPLIPTRRRKDKEPPPKPSPWQCPVSFPHTHQSQSHSPGRQASNSGVTVYTLTSPELPRVYLFYSWGPIQRFSLIH